MSSDQLHNLCGLLRLASYETAYMGQYIDIVMRDVSGVVYLIDVLELDSSRETVQQYRPFTTLCGVSQELWDRMWTAFRVGEGSKLADELEAEHAVSNG